MSSLEEETCPASAFQGLHHRAHTTLQPERYCLWLCWAWSCPTLSTCSLPGFSVHGTFQALRGEERGNLFSGKHYSPQTTAAVTVHLHFHLPSYLTEAEPLVQHRTSPKASKHWSPGLLTLGIASSHDHPVIWWQKLGLRSLWRAEFLTRHLTLWL